MKERHPSKINKTDRRAKTILVLAALFALFACTLAACAAPPPPEASASTLLGEEISTTPIPTPTPAPTPAPTPSDGKVHLSPDNLLSLLFEKRTDPTKSKEDTFAVDCGEIAAILEAHGEEVLADTLRENADAYVAMEVNERSLYHQGKYETPEGDREYAVLTLNNHRLAYCLIFKNKDDWLLTDHFPSGEVVDSQTAMGIQTAVDALYGKQTWLTVTGLINSGSAMATANCIWYNLNTDMTELNYVPAMHRYQDNHPLQYRVEGEAEVGADQDGRLLFTVRYRYELGNAAHFAENADANKNAVSLTHAATETWNWEPASLFLPACYGYFDGAPEHELSVWDAFSVCEKELRAMRKKNNAAQKAWIEALDIAFDHEYNSRILVHAVGYESLPVGRYAGTAPAPRLDFLSANPTFAVRPGTAFSLDFDQFGPPYSLTRYQPLTKERVPVPTINNRFFAEEQEGTLLYTLEYTTYGGLNSYDFLIVTAKDAPAPSDASDAPDDFVSPLEEEIENELPETKAVSLGLSHIEAIMGYPLSAKTLNVSSVLRKGMGAIPDEWDMRYSVYDIPQLQFNLRCVAQTGNITYFSCTYKDLVSGGPAALSLTAPPAGTEKMDMEELALYYYDLLPVDDQGELRRVEYKRDVKNDDGSTITQIYVRFKSDNVFAIDFDKDTKRPVWICMYYK